MNQNEEGDDRQKLKQKREEAVTEIRRQTRHNDLNKLRKLDIQDKQIKDIDGVPGQMNQTELSIKNYIDQVLKEQFTINDFPNILNSINSNDVFKQHYGVIGIRKILSVEDGPPIQIVIDANLVPRLIEMIKQEVHPHLQLEACWALTNIASGSSHQTQAIIDKQGIQLIVKLLESKHAEIAEQAIWALGNIAGDCAIYRDMILKSGGLRPLIKIIESSSSASTIKHGTWTLSNLCRGRPLPKFEMVKDAIPTLAKVLKHQTESEVLTDAAWALSYLSDGDNSRIDMVIDTLVIPSLIKLLKHPFLSILIPCLRTLGNIVTGDDVQTNQVLQEGALADFFELLNHEKRSVRREACWTLSNITAGNANQIHLIVQNEGYVAKLQQLMLTDVAEIKREASWVLSNATNQGYPQDVLKLVELGVFKSFVELLSSDDVKTLGVVLEAINNILKKGKENFMQNGINPFATMLQNLNAVSRIEQLQEHPSDDIYAKCLSILENHFELENLI